MSTKNLAYVKALALEHTKQFGEASTDDILERAGVDMATLSDDDAENVIGEFEDNLPGESVMMCRAQARGGKSGGTTGSVSKFLKTGNRRDLPKPTQDEAEATATALSGMALARNGDDNAAPVTELDPEKIYAKWNSAGKNRKAAEAE